LKDRFGVRSLGFFGSIVRGEASPQSDIDVLVEFAIPSFDHYMELKFYLEDLLGRPVDLVLKGNLIPSLRERILREVRDVA
jgi:predicted nucleotidyltransferase